MPTDMSLYEKAVELKSIIIEAATDGRYIGNEDAALRYKKIRLELLENQQCMQLMPEKLSRAHTLDEICVDVKKQKSPDIVGVMPYRKRREIIDEFFQPFLDSLQLPNGVPLEQEIIAILENTNSKRVSRAWQKVLDRRHEDLDGAITAARTLLETVCKFVLDRNNIPFKNNCTFPELYRRTSESLNLTPNAETEGVMRQLMDGCSTVINSVGSLRNQLGDAHGKREHFIDAKQHHVELIVNITCSVALFLIATWEELNI